MSSGAARAQAGALAAGVTARYLGGMADQTFPCVSLIIPTYGREEPLVACLRCALNQSYRPLEILVIDQTGEHDPETVRFLQGAADRVRVIRHAPPSAVTARNCGLHEARGEILIFIDDDTTFGSGFAAAHVAAHRRGAEVVQGRVVEPGRGVAHRPQWVRPWLRFVGSNTHDRAGVTNTLTGCNFSLSRRAADRVGEFDPLFCGALVREDADYGARCRRAGLRMVFDADACLTHHRAAGGVDRGVTGREREFDLSLLRNELYFARKHFAPPAVWLYKLRMARRLRRIARRSGGVPPHPIRKLIRQADGQARLMVREGELPELSDAPR